MLILIADDHAIVRRGLRHILADEFQDANIIEAQNGVEALKLVRRNHFHVVVLDINMPGGGGLEALKELRHEHPRLPILMLSVHSEEQYAVRALRAGASGYIPKESASDELVKAVRTVLTGRRYITASLAEHLADALNGAPEDCDKPTHEALSDREYQVMRLLAGGKTVSQIAGELLLSVKTVSTFRSRLLTKLHLKTTAELMHYAVQHGLVD